MDVRQQNQTATPPLEFDVAGKQCDDLYEQVMVHCGLHRDKIETILPCTSSQIDVIDFAATDGKRAIGRAIYDIPRSVDTKRLAIAWKEVVRQTPALRTYIFIPKVGCSFQVVLAESFFSWMYSTSIDMKEAIVHDETAAAMIGPRCNRYVVLEDIDKKQRLLIWTFSYALVDSALQQHILQRVLTAYEGGKVQYSNWFGTSLSLQAGNLERAARFWQQHFDGLDASVFPSLPSHLATPHPNTYAEHCISYLGPVQQKWSNTVVCRAALAVLLSGFTHSPEALFGVVMKPSHKSEEEVDGLTQAVVPIRVQCSLDQSVLGIMEAITAHDHAMHEFAQVGLCNIRRMGDDESAACEFQTVLLVTESDASQAPSCAILQNTEESNKFIPCANRALLLSCQMASDSVLLAAHYDQSVIDAPQMTRFLRQLGFLIQQLQQNMEHLPLVRHLDAVTQDDQAEIEAWNSERLQTQDALIHDVISKRASDAPDSTAVSSWDGEWTYSELDNVSSRLAAHIQSLDLGQGQAILPLCFEKSKWIIASILAVLKAGRAFTLIDPCDPPARMAQVCRQTGATVALTSSLHSSTIATVIDRCIVINDDFLQSLSRDTDQLKPTAKPQDMAYCIFTSGSTGEPKGIMIEHRGFVSCAVKFGPALGINPQTHALQFASYAFGACLVETVTVLMHGGCVCIPSDDDRMNSVPDFIRKSNINWVILTPSYIGTLQPENVSGLQTLVLVGEPISASIRDIWAPRVQLLHAYGQSESSTICSVTRVTPFTLEPNNIGRAVGARSWIVDPNDSNKLVPIGCVGELVIESPGIARDYIVALPPDESPFFVTTPVWYPTGQASGGFKFYRTGDLVRYRSDGTVVCLGRKDSQVKIRGQRVEISEVEARLRQQLPGRIMPVAEAVKTSDLSSGKTLIAFLIGSLQNEENGVFIAPTSDTHVLDHSATKDINGTLQQVLPTYSVPSYYISMKNLPRTATGKADRKKLRSIAGKLLSELAHNVRSQPCEKFGPPATMTEVKLRELWYRALNLDFNSENDGASFFELGGDSIAAIRMVNMARIAGIPLKVSDIFQNPTFADLLDVIGRDSTPYVSIPLTTYAKPVEQSFAQGRLWFLDQLELGASWYLLPYAVRMRGLLQTGALRVALLALEQRHETLRTTFEEKDGVGVQVVHASIFQELKTVDLSDDQNDGYLQLLQQQQTTPFDLASEAGWRVSLIRLGENDHVLSIVMHHIISDGWSTDILRRELGQFYAAALQGHDPLSMVKPLPIHYRDFSAWQKQEEQVAEHQKQLEYWTNQLANSSPAEFATDFPRPTILSGKAGYVPVTIEGDLYRSLREFCRAKQMTPFTVLLAAFRAAHYRLTGTEDAVIGTPIANRNRRELENIIGFFVNTQCMRITVDDDETFESLVRQVRLTATAAFEHQDVPFDRVVSGLLPGSRDLSRNPLAQLMFAVHSQQDFGNFELEGLEAEPLLNQVYTRFDIEFHLFQETNRLSGNLVFAADLFELEKIRNVASVFFEILSQGLAKPHIPIAVIPFVDGVMELRNMGLLEVEKTGYPRDASIIDVFRTQVNAYPHSFAVVDSKSRLTYAELDHQSNQIATWLRQRGIAPETLIGVLAPRSCETVIAFFGILKANLAYLPLDINSPAARLRAILSSLPQHRLVLLGSDVTAPEIQLPGLELAKISDILIERRDVDDMNGDADKTSLGPSATSLAYVIFTSGSTGRPKGVMIEHRSVVRLVKETNITSRFPFAVKVAHLSNIAFDAATWEIFAALLNGGTLVCIDYMTILDSKEFEAVFAQEQVNAALFTPALLKQCVANIPSILKELEVLVIGGDRLDGQDSIAAQALVRAGVFNAYGPTENGVISTVYTIEKNDSFINGVPIGRPISNSGAYIMDSCQQIVPIGVVGELVVTGDGLARGYTDLSLDAGRFVQVVIDGQAMRAYRTGDQGRYRPGDGQIEFLGRMDQQIKIRGHRIEPAEIERAFLSQDSVRDAVVVIRDHESQEPEMVGFVVTQDDDHTAEQEEAGNQVEGWNEFFESNTYADIDTIAQSAIGNDFKGWTSMYDGNEIDKTEMHEWLDDTIHTLLDGQPPGHVLEIGTGSGMILFNLGTGLQSYVGLEPSKSAATFVTKAIESIPALDGRANVHVGSATDVGQLDHLYPELVVLNSVVQYFPSSDYLEQLVDTLVRKPGVQRIFFGDIRSLATNKHFLAARALHALGHKPTRGAVRQKMTEMEEREEELLVDPAFFTMLEKRHPNHIKHIEILPKKMQATNELSAYRYAAIIHIRGSEEQDKPLYQINMDEWIDFQESRVDQHTLLSLLKDSTDALTVAVSNIPYRKTIFERHIVDSLDEESGESETQNLLDGAAWISAVHADAESCSSLSATDLVRLGEEAGFRVEVSAARQWSQYGALDAVFHRYDLHTQKGDRALIRFPTDNKVRASASLTNRPLQRLQSRRFVSQIREQLQSLLPSYMVPSHIVLIDQMPLNANGKVDRKSLTRRAQVMAQKPQERIQQVLPLNEIEVVLCKEFAEVFGIQVGINDHFFKLGGHSLLATKLTARIGRRLNTRVSVKDIFDQPVIGDLAATIRRELASRGSIPVSSYSGNGKQMMSAQVAPRNEIETVLCAEFSYVLGIDVGITDHFFDLGGHSLMATKLASRISRRIGVPVSVKDIFDQPVPLHLAAKIELIQSENYEVTNGVQTNSSTSFQLISMGNPLAFIENEISPQLGYSHGTIQDIYPATQMQRLFLFNPTTGHPRTPTPFYIDFPSDSDCSSLETACKSLIERIDIFRTIFLEVAGELYQIVLKHLDLAIEIIETEENINSATRAFLDMDLKQPIRLGQPLIRIAILKAQKSSLRVILRMSHALYDGLSLEHIVRSLHVLYSGGILPPSAQFSRYMQHIADSRKEGYDFWRCLLQDASMAVIRGVNRSAHQEQVVSPGTYHASKVISVPLQANSSITPATVFTTACAIVLSKEAKTNDVVFGRIVSGRQGLPVTCQNIIGPCTNEIPVRAYIHQDTDRKMLLRKMQDQYLSSLSFEALGFDEIKKNCTDWPEAMTNYSCCIAYQNFDYHPDSQMNEQRVQIGVLSRDIDATKEVPLHDLVISGEAELDGPYLHVTIAANRQVCEEGRVIHMLRELCETISSLNLAL
ncbi:NRPS [Trichoderma atroviride]|uniref:NRPS n=1 Tax=Hypocrea atroviridis TaxID=63577 RepID=UPI00331D10AC|nr:NRPS [Trichoderma atroviride]